MIEKQAIIDLGSNTTRMLVIEVLDNGGYRLAEEAKAVVRLAENMSAGNVIRPPALQRSIEAMRLFRSICDYHGVNRITATATAAVRDAANRAEFLAALGDASGIEFRVLSREDEAYYGYLGVINSLDVRDCLLVDLGGGSMEITSVRERKIADTVSLRVGSLSLTERFLSPDRSSEAQLSTLEDFVRFRLKAVPWLQACRGKPLIGIGGTCRNIGKIHQRLVNYPFDELHNYPMHTDEIAFIYGNLKSTSLEDRRNLDGLSKDRADIIVGGVAAVVTLLRYLNAPSLRLSSWGLRDGLFYHSFLERPVVDDVFTFSVGNIQRLYHLDDVHASHVARLALELFDGLKTVHRLGIEYGKLLWAAAKLHESGYFYDYHNRFANTFYNIINDTIFGLDQYSVYKVALVAGFYGAGGLKNANGIVAMLSKDENKALRKLGVLLAIADAFDRRRRRKVAHLNCRVEKYRVTIQPEAADDCWLERRTSAGLAGYFQKAFDAELSIDREQ